MLCTVSITLDIVVCVVIGVQHVQSVDKHVWPVPKPDERVESAGDVPGSQSKRSCTSKTTTYVVVYIMWILYIANRSRWKSFIHVVVKLKCNSLENIHSLMMFLYGQGLMHRLFHQKSSVATNQSIKTSKLPPRTICNMLYVAGAAKLLNTLIKQSPSIQIFVYNWWAKPAAT